MYNPETEILFPSKAIYSLSKLRGSAWQKLIDTVNTLPIESIEQAAFVLMMVKIGGCVTCNVDSFRAMRGCPACAQLNIKRYKGTDDDLVHLYEQALKETNNYFSKKN